MTSLEQHRKTLVHPRLTKWRDFQRARDAQLLFAVALHRGDCDEGLVQHHARGWNRRRVFYWKIKL